MTRAIPLAAVAWLAAVSLATAGSPFELVKTILFPGTPGKLDHFAMDLAGGRLFVSKQGNSSLDVIDVKTGNVLAQVAGQKRIHGIAYLPGLDRVFVGNGDPGECAAIDGKTYAVLKRLPVKAAGCHAFAKRKHASYLWLYGAKKVSQRLGALVVCSDSSMVLACFCRQKHGTRR